MQNVSTSRNTANDVGVACSNCGPRLSEAAADKLKNQYVLMRGGARQHEKDVAKKNAIPITIRYRCDHMICHMTGYMTFQTAGSYY